MQKLTPKAKEAIVQKALSRCGTIAEVARANNVAASTLYEWMKRYKEGAPIDRNYTKQSDLPASERLEHLLATASLDEVSISRYCREKGLYAFQLKQWKKAFMNEKSSNDKARQVALKELEKENKALKQEIMRKDKALSEATALLILKKKAALIWGELEDD